MRLKAHSSWPEGIQQELFQIFQGFVLGCSSGCNMRLPSHLLAPWPTIFRLKINSNVRRHLATVTPSGYTRVPQTFIEKVVQKYAVGLPEGKVVKAGDYVMIQPEHVMTHDNTGPVISKCVPFCVLFLSTGSKLCFLLDVMVIYFILHEQIQIDRSDSNTKS